MRPDSSVHWSSYPALLVAALLATGVLVDASLGVPPISRVAVWAAGAGLAVVVFGAVQVWDRVRLVTLAPLGRVVAAALLAFSVGGLSHASYTAPSPQALRTAAAVADSTGELSTVWGQIVDSPTSEIDSDTRRFTLQTDSVRIGAYVVRPAHGRVRVTLYDAPWADDGPFPDVRAGDRLRFTGSLRPARGPRNPEAFDYAAYLDRRGVCCSAYVSSPGDVAVTGHVRGPVDAWVNDARAHVRQQLRDHVPTERARGVLRALLLGDRSRVSDAERDRFALTGLMHLLAVSGLHVMLVGMVLYGLLRPLLMRLRMRWTTVELLRAGLTIAVLAFYMLLTGTRPSVVRAVVMTTLLIGGILFQRSSHALNTLGVAAVVLLVARPPMLFDVGFQLSMTAVAGIVTLHPRFHAWMPASWLDRPAVEWLFNTTSVSVAATLATAPVLVTHFGGVSVGGVLLNTAAIPCTALGLSAGIATVTAGGIWAPLGTAFGASADAFIQVLLWIAEVGAQTFEGGFVRTGVARAWLPALLVAGWILLVQWPRPRTRWTLVALSIAVGVLQVGGEIASGRSRPVLDVLFFDVGQGDAALVTMPNGTRLLVDAGPRSRYSDAAERILLPYFDRHGIRRLDAVVITHPDSDHLGGLPTLMREMHVKRVLHSGQPSSSFLYAESREVLDARRIAHGSVAAGDTLALDPSVRIEVLGPPSNPDAEGVHGENDGSVVLRVTFGQVDVLLTGDVETGGEQFLVKRYGTRLASELVKVAHHGSSTSSIPTFVDASVEPGTRAIVSVGRRNSYGHPDEDVVRRWTSSEATLLSTARENAVWFQSDGESVWQVDWK